MAFPAAAFAGSRVTVVVSLPPSQLPESVAIDHHGNLYLSIANQGEILKVARDGTQSVYATFPPGAIPPGGFNLGIRFDEQGAAYVATTGGGIWRIPPGGGTPVQVAPASDFAGGSGFLNGLAFDHEGNLYVSDSFAASIYRLTPDGSVSLWASSPLLAGTSGNGPCGQPHPFGNIGANGIAFNKHGDMLVANTSVGDIVRIRVNRDGGAGTASVFAGPDCSLWGADGLAMDSEDNLYVAANAANDIVRVSPAGHLRVLASAAAGDPLANPSDIAFGTDGARKDIFITNFAAFSGGVGSGAVTMDAGIPGRPLP